MNHCKHGKTEYVYCADCHVEELQTENKELREALSDIQKAYEGEGTDIQVARKMVGIAKRAMEVLTQ